MYIYILILLLLFLFLFIHLLIIIIVGQYYPINYYPIIGGYWMLLVVINTGTPVRGSMVLRFPGSSALTPGQAFQDLGPGTQWGWRVEVSQNTYIGSRKAWWASIYGKITWRSWRSLKRLLVNPAEATLLLNVAHIRLAVKIVNSKTKPRMAEGKGWPDVGDPPSLFAGILRLYISWFSEEM